MTFTQQLATTKYASNPYFSGCQYLKQYSIKNTEFENNIGIAKYENKIRIMGNFWEVLQLEGIMHGKNYENIAIPIRLMQAYS